MATTDAPIRPVIPENLLDKAIKYVSPKTAARRMQARGALEAMALMNGKGGYNGARLDKASLSRWLPGGGSANSDIIGDLPTLRDRSRDQMRNSPVALGGLNTATSHVVGTGLSFTPLINGSALGMSTERTEAWQNETKRRFDAWAESADCSLDRTQNFYGLQDLCFRSWHESGDAFVNTPRVARRTNGSKRLALQLIEADRVCNPDRKADTETLIDGVEISAETGEAMVYHVARLHPGDYGIVGKNTWTPVKARGETGQRHLLHIFKPVRPGQVRGVPWIAPILEPLKQLNRWTDNEINAAVTSSLFSVFIKMDPGAFEDLFDDQSQQDVIKAGSKWSGAMESGKAINLLPGESVETAAMNRPNPEFDPFWTAMVRQIGMALEIPYEMLVMHFQSSYTAARAAMLMGWKFFRARRDLFVTLLCKPVYELWLTDEVAEGRIACPGFFADDMVRAAWCAGVWTGDGPGSVDPQKEVQAARDRVDMEISTLDAESILYDGISWEVKHAQRTKEVAMQKRDGTRVEKAGAPAPIQTPEPASAE